MQSRRTRCFIEDRTEFDIEVEGIVHERTIAELIVSAHIGGSWRDITKWLNDEDKAYYEEKLLHFSEVR